MLGFHVVPGATVVSILSSSRERVATVVRDTYLAHEAGDSVNPDSYFLRFPDKPDSRVIALPAYLGGDTDRIGIKWISSFPGNIAEGKPRASAALLLNDYATGYPIACLEAAAISAARTAASAALAAATLTHPTEPRHVAFIGAGVIARNILDYLLAAEVRVQDVRVHDRDQTSADHLVRYANAAGLDAGRADSLTEALRADLVVFATTAANPYVPADTELRPGQTLLNVSLRDLPPELLLRTNNVLDDVDHCLKAQTSPHLAEQLTGSREFINGTLGQLLTDKIALDPGKATVFSPFGLGVLDIAVGEFVLREALRTGEAVRINSFFGEEERW